MVLDKSHPPGVNWGTGGFSGWEGRTAAAAALQQVEDDSKVREQDARRVHGKRLHTIRPSGLDQGKHEGCIQNVGRH